MNKCEIEDCELCAPLKGKYYHHAYENAKNVRFCNSNKNAAFLSKFSWLQLNVGTAWKMLHHYLVKNCNDPRKCCNFELHFYLLDLNCIYFMQRFRMQEICLQNWNAKKNSPRSLQNSRAELILSQPNQLKKMSTGADREQKQQTNQNSSIFFRPIRIHNLTLTFCWPHHLLKNFEIKIENRSSLIFRSKKSPPIFHKFFRKCIFSINWQNSVNLNSRN